MLKKYVITGINRLTGEREAISGKHNYLQTQKMLSRWQKIYREKKTPLYTFLKMEEAEESTK